MASKSTGRGRGKPSIPPEQKRPSAGVSPSVRSWAILDLAVKRRGYEGYGYLLDDHARDLERDLRRDTGLTDADIDAQMQIVIKRLHLA